MSVSPEPIPRSLATPGDGDVQVWWSRIDVDDDAQARSRRTVDPATLARADRMRRPDDQRRVLLAHALLRQLLEAVTGVAAATIELQRRCASCGSTEHGRPFLTGGPSFGLSHGGGLVVVALGAPAADVAVDVEAVQPAERWDAVRRHAFSDAEWAATAGAGDDAAVARTAHWCRKEAAVKATGYGLEIELTRVAFEPVVPARPLVPSQIHFAAGEPAAPAGAWSVADVELAAGHCVAVALRTPVSPLSIGQHQAAL